jgi:hypothetical protein
LFSKPGSKGGSSHSGIIAVGASVIIDGPAAAAVVLPVTDEASVAFDDDWPPDPDDGVELLAGDAC